MVTMIQYTGHEENGGPEGVKACSGAPAFVSIWATGGDPAHDGIFRVLALRPDDQGGWIAFDQLTDPFPDSPREGATARMAREFGVQRADIEDCPDAPEVWAALESFLGDAPVVTLDGRDIADWAKALGGNAERRVLGLDELALLLVPGRLATRRSDLLQVLLPSGQAQEKGARLNRPEALVSALAHLVERFLNQDPSIVALVLGGLTRTLRGLQKDEPTAAMQLEFALDLLDRPSVWALSTGDLFEGSGGLRDGCLADTPGPDVDLSALLNGLPPAASSTADAWRQHEELPPAGLACTPSHADDESRLEELFEHHLPSLLANEYGGQAADFYRRSQHEVARQVAQTLGRDELLLVHAPTGTGKTLAYLLPAMLWARRHGVRVAIATYTRALQEQAMDREVPRALSALARAGDTQKTRVSVLKGRKLPVLSFPAHGHARRQRGRRCLAGLDEPGSLRADRSGWRSGSIPQASRPASEIRRAVSVHRGPPIALGTRSQRLLFGSRRQGHLLRHPRATQGGAQSCGHHKSGTRIGATRNVPPCDFR